MSPISSASLALLLSALAVGSARAQNYQIPETVLPCGSVTAPTDLRYGAYVDTCLVAGTAVAKFTFTGEAGDTVLVHLRSQTGGFDPRLRIFDPLNQAVPGTQCATASGVCTLGLTLNLTVGGSYTLLVDDLGNDENGHFRLGIERQLPHQVGPGLPLGFVFEDTIQPTTDFDFSHFEAQAGDLLELRLFSLTGGFDPHLAVFGPDGSLAAFTECTTASGLCALTLPYTPTQSGTHTVRIFDLNVDELASYRLTVNCLLGSCPDTPHGLYRSVPSISLQAGGSSLFTVDAGPEQADRLYLLFGSFSGYLPGTELPEGVLAVNAFVPGIVPAQLDPYFELLALRPEVSPLVGAVGVLDVQGRATADLIMPAGSPAVLAGLRLHHSYVVVDLMGTLGITQFGNPVALDLLP
jgi:hypothetical protein